MLQFMLVCNSMIVTGFNKHRAFIKESFHFRCTFYPKSNPREKLIHEWNHTTPRKSTIQVVSVKLELFIVKMWINNVSIIARAIRTRIKVIKVKFMNIFKGCWSRIATKYLKKSYRLKFSLKSEKKKSIFGMRSKEKKS